MWNVLGSGMELVSPALAGGFLSIVPPGKSDIPSRHLIFPFNCWQETSYQVLLLCSFSIQFLARLMGKSLWRPNQTWPVAWEETLYYVESYETDNNWPFLSYKSDSFIWPNLLLPSNFWKGLESLTILSETVLSHCFSQMQPGGTIPRDHLKETICWAIKLSQ